MKKHYSPPNQGIFGQIFDSLFILILVYASLMIPLLLKAEEKAESAVAAVTAAANSTWESLGQNAVQQAQWIKLGYNPEQAAVLINDRFDYTIDPLMLVITIAVIAGYFIFMLTVSKRQYREVIAEKFDK
jgi:hypothetical protein